MSLRDPLLPPAPKPIREIEIPLTEALLKMVYRPSALISDQFMAILGPVDKVGTTVTNYPRVYTSIVDLSSTGPVIDYLSDEDSESRGIRALYFMVLAALVWANSKLHNEEHNEMVAKAKRELEKLRFKIDFNFDIKEFNDCFKKMVKQHPVLRARYKYIRIQGQKLIFGMNDDALDEELLRQKSIAEEAKRHKWYQKIWHKILKPIWDWGTLSSLAFWGIWIVALAATGIPSEGVANLSQWFSLGIPAALGTGYLGIKIKNWYQNGRGNDQKARDTKMAALDALPLLKQARRKLQYEREMELLASLQMKYRNQLKMPALSPPAEIIVPHVVGTYRDRQVKMNTAIAFTNTSVDQWGMSQFITWYGAVLFVALETSLALTISIPISHTDLGGILIGISLAFGVAKGVKSYKEARAANGCSRIERIESHEQCTDQGTVYLKQENDGLKAYWWENGEFQAHAIAEDDQQAIFAKINGNKKIYQDDPLFETIMGHIKYDAFHSRDLRITGPVMVLEQAEDHYEKRKKYLQTLMGKLQDYQLILPETRFIPEKFLQQKKPKEGYLKKSAKSIRNSEWMDAWDWEMSGIFILRMVVTPTAATFLPFAALALSNPWTIGLILVLGTAIVMLKWYQKVQERREQRIKALPQKIERQEKEIQLAERAVSTMELKRNAKLAVRLSNDKNKAVSDNLRNLKSGNGPTFFHPNHFDIPSLTVTEPKLAPKAA